MKEFHFCPIYFKKLIFDDPKTGIRIVINEEPSLEIHEEGYSLRVETRHEEVGPIHRNFAIEHHLDQEKHREPHIQFKFHTEEVGTFRIRLDFADAEEYHRAVLGFIYKIRLVIGGLEKYRPGICDEVVVLELVDKLADEGKFLEAKISEGLKKFVVEFADDKRGRLHRERLKSNQLLLDFLGKENIERMAEQ